MVLLQRLQLRFHEESGDAAGGHGPVVAGYRPVHKHHAVSTDLSQSVTQFIAIFSTDFCLILVSQALARHALTRCSFFVFLVQLPNTVKWLYG